VTASPELKVLVGKGSETEDGRPCTLAICVGAKFCAAAGTTPNIAHERTSDMEEREGMIKCHGNASYRSCSIYQGSRHDTSVDCGGCQESEELNEKLLVRAAE
jgi:hypothetical protein